MDLTVSIVNHNGRQFLEKCIGSVFAAAGGMECEVFVVDNCSEDGSAEFVRKEFPRVTLMENESRAGFAANHNRVLRRAAGEFVLLLNNDTEVKPGALEALVRFMRDNPGAGLAGPRLLNPDGTLQQSCFRTPTPGVLFFDAFFISSILPGNRVTGGYKKWAHDSMREVPSLSGACLIARAEAVRRVGPLDEDFFMYFEDHDWCARFRAAGWKVCFVPQAEVLHYGGGSEGELGHDRFDRFYSSMDRYYEKHFGRSALPAVAALNVAGSALRLAGWGAASIVSPGARNALKSRGPYFARRIKWYMKDKRSEFEIKTMD